MSASSNDNIDVARKPTNDHRGYITDLIEVMIETLEIFAERSIKTSLGNNPLIRFIEDYNKVLKASKFEDHGPLFATLYRAHRQNFLSILDFDDFLVKGDLQIWYGANIPRVKKRNIRLPLSACYRTAARMRDDIDSTLTGNTETDAAAVSKPEYIIPSEILYYIMCIIKVSLDPTDPDISELDKIIKELAEDAGIGRQSGSIGSGFNGIINTVANSLSKAGIKGSDGKEIDTSSIPGSETIGKMVNQMFDNKELTGAMTNVFSNLNNSANASGDSSENMITGIFNTLAPAMKGAMMDIARPPPGVEVSEESQRHAQEMADNFGRGMEKVAEVMGQVNFGNIVNPPAAATVDESDESDESYSGSDSE